MQYLVVLFGIFGLELKIKNKIEATKKEGQTEEKCGGFVLIRKHHNTGAFLNTGDAWNGGEGSFKVGAHAAAWRRIQQHL